MLAAFRDGKVRTLVATDIAARGIDVDGISHVVNYDLPNIPESYVHRIGRTARAGADGVAISFCDGEERAYLRDIEKLIRMSIPATGQLGTHRPEPRTHDGGARAAAAASRQRRRQRPVTRPSQWRPQQRATPSRGSQQPKHRQARTPAPRA